ncbi:MAG: BrnT family toxin [Candidatus Puniceispirillaceae bacterium]
MKIEWDEQKRQKTLNERGLDFADLESVNWEEANTIADTRQPYPEDRFITFASVRGRLCVFAWCYCGDSIRVFSLREANQKEVTKYERSKGLY